MSRVRQLLPLALLGIAIVSALFAPRLLDYAFGVVFLAGAVVGLLSSPDRPTGEPGGLQWNGTWRVMGVGVIGLFGGGAIAWGWITAARVASGVVGIALLVLFSRWSRERRGEEEMGCGLLLLLFAATGWFGLFPTYFEQELWPGTPAGHTAPRNRRLSADMVGGPGPRVGGRCRRPLATARRCAGTAVDCDHCGCRCGHRAPSVARRGTVLVRGVAGGVNSRGSCIHLVPRLCLGTHSARLCLADSWTADSFVPALYSVF